MPVAMPAAGNPTGRESRQVSRGRLHPKKGSAKQGLIRVSKSPDGEQRFRARQLTSQANAGVKAHRFPSVKNVPPTAACGCAPIFARTRGPRVRAFSTRMLTTHSERPRELRWYHAGPMLYEIEGLDEVTAREAFRLAAAKLSVQTQFVTRAVM